MNAPQTILSLQEVARRLNRAGVPWAVFAGAAASVYGATRPLTDVDILIPAAYGGRAAALFPEGQANRREGGAVHIVQLPGFDLVAGLTWREGDSTYTMDLDEQMAAHLPALDWEYLQWRVDACGSGPRMGWALERVKALRRQVGAKSPLETDRE